MAKPSILDFPTNSTTMKNRKSEEEKAATKFKKRALVPFTAPKDVATKALVARNASCSPFLLMPLEIRIKIWKLVLGDRLIHFGYLATKAAISMDQNEGRRCCKHVVCRQDCPEHQMTKSEVDWRQPHQECHFDLLYKMGYRDPPMNSVVSKQPESESMHLTALRVCRQVYNEANNILWTTNTFSFSDAAPTFAAFMEAQTTPQKQLMRKLRLQMNWVSEEHKDWNGALNVTLIRSMTGLRSLRLHINYIMGAVFSHKWEARRNKFGLFQTPEFVDRLAILSLSDVEVFVSDLPPCIGNSSPHPPHIPSTSWTAENKMEYTDGIRKMLLDPKGAELYAQKQEKSH